MKAVCVFAMLAATAFAASPQLRAATELHAKAKDRKLLPIGEGAYQSAEAVAQRTTDKTMHCEDGKWEDCMHNDKSDLLDGHSYGNIKDNHYVPRPPHPFGGAAHKTLYLGLLAPLL